MTSSSSRKPTAVVNPATNTPETRGRRATIHSCFLAPRDPAGDARAAASKAPRALITGRDIPADTLIARQGRISRSFSARPALIHLSTHIHKREIAPSGAASDRNVTET